MCVYNVLVLEFDNPLVLDKATVMGHERKHEYEKENEKMNSQ